jgi:phosphatidylglycerophosphatase A
VEKPCKYDIMIIPNMEEFFKNNLKIFMDDLVGMGCRR